MPLPVIADTYRVAIKWAEGNRGGYGINVLHFQWATGDESDLWDVLNANWQNDLQASMSGSSTMQSVDILKLDGVSGTLNFPRFGNSDGQGGGEPIEQAATIIALKTGQAGPARRGRIFMPFVGEGEQDAGGLAPATVTVQQAAWDTFEAACDADDAFLSVASYVNEDVVTVSTVVVRPIVGTIKKRLDRTR